MTYCILTACMMRLLYKCESVSVCFYPSTDPTHGNWMTPYDVLARYVTRAQLLLEGYRVSCRQ